MFYLKKAHTPFAHSNKQCCSKSNSKNAVASSSAQIKWFVESSIILINVYIYISIIYKYL